MDDKAKQWYIRYGDYNPNPNPNPNSNPNPNALRLTPTLILTPTLTLTLTRYIRYGDGERTASSYNVRGR